MIIKSIEGSVDHKTNNLILEAEAISFGTNNFKTPFCNLIYIYTAFLNFEVLNN